MDQPNPADHASRLAPGSAFGNYQVLERLGAGGMGEVYRARDTRLGREVALKTIRIDRAGHTDALQRFEQEARSASSLNHPNIITIYELGHCEGTHYIAMELLNGMTLRDQLRTGVLPVNKVIRIATQVAEALAKAHEIGIVHRDIKPENIMVDAEGVAKVVDFGLAKLTAAQPKPNADSTTQVLVETEAGAIVGSISYMSPEQARGEAVDFRSDQFSLASVLFEMITGHPPFHRRTSAETLVAIMHEEPTTIGTVSASIPAPLLWIVERCLAKDPKDRYASTRDLARDLMAVRDRVSTGLVTPIEARANNLPLQRTAFIGRDVEVHSLRDLLLRPEARLITLTGPGGIGKTRLALRVAEGMEEDFAGGICFVPLAAITEPGNVLATIAQALGVRDTGSQPVVAALQEYLRSLRAPALLVLDNFEHLVEAASGVADLTSAKLKIVITSQSPLHVYGEHEFPVPPLNAPDPKRLPSLPALMRQPAVALFVERAQAVKRDFAITSENARAVATICHRLDGLPLAIELAAARVKLLSPLAMQSRLESSLNLLTGGARDLPTRQQTLRATIDWSYNLLNEAEQRLFRRLAVFVGGCTFEGVEAVCDTRSDLGIDILDGMSSMMDKSLVRQVNSPDEEPRFVMLATIREYALERLRSSGEEAAVRRAHAAFCLILAEESTGTDQSQWLSRFDAEQENFRAALDHLIQSNDADWGLRLGTALFHYWETRELLAEGRERLGALLQMPGARSDSKLRARALFAAGVLAGEQGDYLGAHEMMAASLKTAQAIQDQQCQAVALNAMAVNARDRGDVDASAALFEQSLAVWRELGDLSATARANSNLANIAKVRGDLQRASALYDECVSMFNQIGDASGVAWSLNYKGDLAREAGEQAHAQALYQQSLAEFRRLGEPWGVASTLNDLGNLMRDDKRCSDAHRLYSESLREFQTLNHQRGVARVLESIALAAALQDDSTIALTLAGAAGALRQRLRAPLSPAEQSRLDAGLQAARSTAKDFSDLWMKGWAMSMEDAVQAALDYNAAKANPTRA